MNAEETSVSTVLHIFHMKLRLPFVNICMHLQNGSVHKARVKLVAAVMWEAGMTKPIISAISTSQNINTLNVPFPFALAVS